MEKIFLVLSPQDRVKAGISFVPQTRNVFADLTVRENLEVGAFLREDDINKVIEEIYKLFPILNEKEITKGWPIIWRTKTAGSSW